MRCGCIDRINKSQSGHNTRLAFLPDLWVRTARSNYASFCANPFLPESNSTLPCSTEYQHPHCRGRESHVFAPHSQLTFLARTNDTLSRSYLSLPSTKGWWTGRSRQGYTSFLVDSQWLDPLNHIISPSGQFDRHHSLSKEAIYNIYLGSVSSVSLYNRMLDSGKIFCPLLLSAQPVFWDRASNLQMDRPGFFTHQARSGDRGIVRHLTELSPENVTCTRAHSTMRTILEPNLRSVWATVTSCCSHGQARHCAGSWSHCPPMTDASVPQRRFRRIPSSKSTGKYVSFLSLQNKPSMSSIILWIFWHRISRTWSAINILRCIILFFFSFQSNDRIQIHE